MALLGEWWENYSLQTSLADKAVKLGLGMTLWYRRKVNLDARLCFIMAGKKIFLIIKISLNSMLLDNIYNKLVKIDIKLGNLYIFNRDN